MNLILKLIQFHLRAGLAISLLFPFLTKAMSASAAKTQIVSCSKKNKCHKLQSKIMITSQIAPIWKFYDGQLEIISDSNTIIFFHEATWDLASNTYYIKSSNSDYSFNPVRLELIKYKAF